MAAAPSNATVVPDRKPEGFGGRIVTGANLVALLLVFASVAVVIAASIVFYQRDRKELVDQFEDERLYQVQDGARLIDTDLTGIGGTSASPATCSRRASWRGPGGDRSGICARCSRSAPRTG